MNSQSAKFDNWKTEYSWSSCKLNNGEYGQFLSSYLRTQKTPLVLNLDGGWGTGKTTFLRQLYCDLHFEHDFPCIYIDAWESDYSNDPLLVIVSELLEQLKRADQHFKAADTEKKILATLGKFGQKAWNTALIGAGTYLSGKLDNSAVVELSKEFTFKSVDAAVIGANLTSNYKLQKQAIEDAREALETLVEFCPQNRRKVFVLIDELDRCRPSYAIEMLETIKHFFELNNYVFVVATDTQQLGNAIQAVYGVNFNGREYLSRFFSRSAKLPEPNLKAFCHFLVEEMNVQSFDNIVCLSTDNKPPNLKESLSSSLAELSFFYGISLRKAQQIAHKFESIVAYAKLSSPSLILDANVLLQLLVEFDSTSFKFIYDARNVSRGVSINLPQKTKEVYTGNNPMVYVAVINGKNREKEFGNNSLIYTKFMFSWVLATESKTKNGEKNTVQAALDNMAQALDQLISVGSEMRVFATSMYELCSGPIAQKQLATCDDYFRFVELATTIVDES
ncbi:KAP family P-loop NTPase fold protein [Vibrio vulnificus]